MGHVPEAVGSGTVHSMVLMAVSRAAFPLRCLQADVTAAFASLILL